MPRTTIAAQSVVNEYPTALTAITFTAADVANMNQTPWTGSEVILARNVHATTTYTITLTSVADSHGRSGTISAENIVALSQKAIPILGADGWRQTDGFIYFQANNASVEFAVLKVKP